MQAPDGGGGGSSWLSGMDSLGQQMADFAASAKAGQVSVNDAGGKALLGAIQEMQAWVRDSMQNARFLRQTGQYGGTHGAGVVEPYMNNVADDADGLTPMLEKFQTVLNDANDAINKAMENYQHTDSGNAADVRQAGGEGSGAPHSTRPVPMPNVSLPGRGGGVQAV